MREDIFDICGFFVLRGIEDQRPITQIKLQKLLYFAQGAYLSLHRRPLFEDTLFAWKYGPVAKKVYRSYCVFGNNPITIETIDQDFFEPFSKLYQRVAKMGEGLKAFLENVWRVFGKFTGFELVEITHMPGSPWYQIYEQFQGDIPPDYPIPSQKMQDYFSKKIRVAT